MSQTPSLSIIIMIQKIFFLIGILFIILGLLYPFLKDFGFGKLPGDIFYKKENSSFYFPIVTCIVVSIVVSLIFMFFRTSIDVLSCGFINDFFFMLM